MKVIYRPKGTALEYAPLAVNLYRGCPHGCKYCYAPAALRMDRQAFRDVRLRENVLEHLLNDVRSPLAKAGPVLLCFSCDPYPSIEEDYSITRQALQILGEAGLPIRVLTKNPTLATRDFDLYLEYGVEFGVSLAWGTDWQRANAEPYAGTVPERIAALVQAKLRGIRTWVSMEPVIDPQSALQALRLLRGKADLVWIGRINHAPALERGVDWRAFRGQALAVAVECGLNVRFKKSLLEA